MRYGTATVTKVERDKTLTVEFKLLHDDRISLFRGVDFTVDEAVGLKGRCDCILARSPEQLASNASVCVLVEARNENIVAGIPQCLAEMVAAQQFNGRAGESVGAVYGVGRHHGHALAVPQAGRDDRPR